MAGDRSGEGGGGVCITWVESEEVFDGDVEARDVVFLFSRAAFLCVGEAFLICGGF